MMNPADEMPSGAGARFFFQEGGDPLMVLEGAHREILNLCDRLEGIADSLPGPVDRLECLATASKLIPLLRDVHRFEEDEIFPRYGRIAGSDGHADATVERLRCEHMEDECYADDLTEALLQLGRGHPIDNPEAFGFMLRGFFDGVRRHVAFEREHVGIVIARG